MPSANEVMRRRVVWAAVLLVVLGVGGWFGYQAVAERREAEARQREDDERLRMARYHDVLRDLEAVGDAGDEATRARCRHAVELLALMEPRWYRLYLGGRPDRGWLPEPPAGAP